MGVINLLLAVSLPLISALESRIFSSYDGTTYVYDYVPARGDNSTFLLLHGFPSTRKEWRPYLSKLTDEGYGVIVPDLLGYGDSDMPLELEAYNLKTISGHFAELVKHEKIEKVIGVGHDWGSLILSRALVWHPETFEKAVFLSLGYNAAGINFDVDGFNIQGLKQLGYMQFGYWYFFNSFDAASVLSQNLESFFHLAFHNNASDLPQTFCALGAVRAWVTANTTTPDPEWLEPGFKSLWISLFSKRDAMQTALNYYQSFLRGYSAVDEARLTDENRKIKVPVMAIGGTKDLVTRFDQLKSETEPWATKGYTQHAVESGHWVMSEAGDAVMKHLKNFARQ
ncbi:hypothetical protein ACHAPV_006032 [Trichoderma viride]